MNDDEIQELIDGAIDDLRIEMQANLEDLWRDIETNEEILRFHLQSELQQQFNDIETRIDELEIS